MRDVLAVFLAVFPRSARRCERSIAPGGRAGFAGIEICGYSAEFRMASSQLRWTRRLGEEPLRRFPEGAEVLVAAEQAFVDLFLTSASGVEHGAAAPGREAESE